MKGFFLQLSIIKLNIFTIDNHKRTQMKKFKTLFIIALISNLLSTVPLILVTLNPNMMEEMVYSQFPGINDVGKEALNLIHSVFAIIALSMAISLIVSIGIKVKESAQTAALILSIIHLGWILPDWINMLMGNAHPPVGVMLLGSVSFLVLTYAWKKGEI
mgnify:FL=1